MNMEFSASMMCRRRETTPVVPFPWNITLSLSELAFTVCLINRVLSLVVCCTSSLSKKEN